MQEIDTKKQYYDMSNDELSLEYHYLDGLVKDCAALGIGSIRQSMFNKMLYARALLDERYLIN